MSEWPENVASWLKKQAGWLENLAKVMSSRFYLLAPSLVLVFGTLVVSDQRLHWIERKGMRK